jgi:hypothetical protein
MGPGQGLERLDGSLWHCRSLSKFVLGFPSDDRQLESFARHVAISQDKRQILGPEIYLDHQYSLEDSLNMKEGFVSSICIPGGFCTERFTA